MKRSKFIVNFRNKLAMLAMDCDSAAAINEGRIVMQQTMMLQSDCESCQLYEGFGQCFEHGYNLVENCKDYKKGE